MNTSKLKAFAQNARRLLLEQVESKLAQVLADGSLARRESAKAVKELEEQIAASSREQVIERVAYTWFNRFCALRFMDANRFTRIGTVSPSEGFQQPEILMEAKQGHIDDDWKVDKQRVLGLLDGTLPSTEPQQEAYRVLFVAVCNSYHSLMPFMFEKIADYTELLIPDDLLSDNSVLTEARNVLTPESCRDVEVIGWLYQFYISEKKDDVFAALKKGKKITPKNIPAATQLFTPHWIVRYLVENSLGRLWMLNHPDSRLVERMDYYIKPEEPETDFLRISSPEEIKICDPACGSGHMLTYAFDLLYAIYEEQGYQATDIPRLILTHNLYGIEIDQRAGALAAFALTMKAREKYKRFLSSGKGVQPNVCVLENIQIEPDDLSAYMDKVGRDLFSGGLQGVVNQWEEADNFGSLIRPVVTDVSEVLELLRERQMGEDLFLASVHQKVLKALKQADYLSPTYHVAISNPPYMGARGMAENLKGHLESQYESGKADLFAAFIQRISEIIVRDGIAGMVTLHGWMFLPTYKEFRKAFLEAVTFPSLVHIGPRGFDAISGEIVQTVAFCFENASRQAKRTTFRRLVDGNSEQEKARDFRNERTGTRFRQSMSSFFQIPDQPVLYWMPDSTLNTFSQGLISDEAKSGGRCKTHKDADYVRQSWEVGSERLFPAGNWKYYEYGGGLRKWFGNRDVVVDWSRDARDFYSSKGGLANSKYWDRTGISWSRIGSGTKGFRLKLPDTEFSSLSPTLIPNSDDCAASLLALLNSNLMSELANALNPSLDVNVGDVLRLPFIQISMPELAGNAKACVDIAQRDWNDYECSLEFRENPIVYRCELGALLESVTSWYRADTKQLVERMAHLETENNGLVNSAYGVEDEVSVAVSSEQISLICNPAFRYGSDKSDSELEALLLADTMRELISYAVGCMLGRYSLDKPGLILANQGETADDYRQQIPNPTFAPDEDNVIPLLDGDWFEDDITERFKAFLKVTFGSEHYEDNLTFLENALYPDNLTGKKRKTIRDYFLKDFYNHHIKLYKKRPIYWLFSSPKGTFNALIYMHRYRPDTASTVLGYLRDFIVKLNASVEHLQSVADGTEASKSEKAKALKEITALKKDIKELNDYEHKVLFPLASQQIAIDLDDGVKVNYNKFGKALKKVTGLTGK